MTASSTHRRQARPVTATFTLIELLVVVAIIAILSSLLLPTLSKARNAARTTDCLVRYKQMGMGMTQYAEENDEVLAHRFKAGGTWFDPYKALRPYLGDYFAGSTSQPVQERNLSNNLGYCPAYEAATSIYAGGVIQTPTVHTYGSVGPRVIETSWRTVNLNDWYNLGPFGHYGSYPKYVVRLPRITSSEFILAGEGWRKSQFENWDELYYNPNHVNRAPIVRLDGGAETMSNTKRKGTGVTWSANSNTSDESRKYWGNYLAPSF